MRAFAIAASSESGGCSAVVTLFNDKPAGR
jgi:hypothetical protein